MVTNSLRTVIQREIRSLRREIEAYPDDATVWAVPPGVKNSGGTLTLHLAGNLQHYFGSRLGGTGYVRNRDAEFSRRDVSRADLLAELRAASAAVDAAFERLSDDGLETTYPEVVGGVTCKTGDFLVHLAVHLGYHLGQIDYHRRLVTSDSRTVDTVSVKELSAAVAAGAADG